MRLYFISTMVSIGTRRSLASHICFLCELFVSFILEAQLGIRSVYIPSRPYGVFPVVSDFKLWVLQLYRSINDIAKKYKITYSRETSNSARTSA